MGIEEEVKRVLTENEERLRLNRKPFNPLTGEGSVGERKRVEIPGFPMPIQWLPKEMLKEPLVQGLIKCKDFKKFVRSHGGVDVENYILDEYFRLRSKYDFAFWASWYVWIKNKGGGEDVRFVLTRPQRRFVEELERSRKANKPIRLILLKARQWGGSTTSQIYMAWLQVVHKTGLNSLIIAQQTAGSDEILDMFRRMMDSYPVSMLHESGEKFNIDEIKFKSTGKSGLIYRVPQRNCKIKIGTANNPDSCRGGDYNLVHCSEVGIWETTDKKTPEQIVRSACSGVLYRPYTMIVYESTANGTGNFFETEYAAAKKGVSQLRKMFVSWYDIDQYMLEFGSNKEKESFCRQLINGRETETALNDRCEPGRYLWWLWEKGATLEAINWYVAERAKYHDHGDIASEYPSDDIEAFVHSGARVFDKYLVEKLEKGCRKPRYVGDVIGDKDTGKDSLKNLHFINDKQGSLWIWSLPENDESTTVKDRYLTVVDIGGRSHKSDWSVIVVLDRLNMIDGDKPVVVAQWYGHIDIDLLAWKAGQIASFYDNSLLVIESNTLETHDRERQIEGGDQSQYVLNQLGSVYGNLYARSSPEDSIVEGRPVKYGFHTNINTKPMVISALIRAVRESAWVERDERCLNELVKYERKQNGSYGAIKGEHDDLLMTRAIGLHICFNEMDLPKIVGKRSTARSKKRSPLSEASL